MTSCSRTRLSLRLLGRQLHRLSLAGSKHYGTVSTPARSSVTPVCLPHIYTHRTCAEKPVSTHKAPTHLKMDSSVISGRHSNFLKKDGILSCMAVDRQTITVGDILPVLKYDCPKTPRNVAEISVPENIKQIIPLDNPGANDEIARESPGQSAPMKQAKDIFFWRRRMMKKHQLRRYKDLHYISLNKTKMDRKARQDRLYGHKLDAIRRKGTEFDALKYVNERVLIARIGGYHINILKEEESRHLATRVIVPQVEEEEKTLANDIDPEVNIDSEVKMDSEVNVDPEFKDKL